MYDYFKNISQKFSLKNINETEIQLYEQIRQNELISKKYNNTKIQLSIILHISISDFANILAIVIIILRYKSIIKN